MDHLKTILISWMKSMLCSASIATTTIYKRNPDDPFNLNKIAIVNTAASMAENYGLQQLQNVFRWMEARPLWFQNAGRSGARWNSHRPLTQIIRYEGKPRHTSWNSLSFDFIKSVARTTRYWSLAQYPHIMLLSLNLYIQTHELIHIVRFSEFLQNFSRVLKKGWRRKTCSWQTMKSSGGVRLIGVSDVLAFRKSWRLPLDSLGRLVWKKIPIDSWQNQFLNYSDRFWERDMQKTYCKTIVQEVGKMPIYEYQIPVRRH